MTRLTNIEKQRLENVLGMGSGYVLDFNNRGFASFFRDVLEVDIDDSRYMRGSGSKANRLRAFWDLADARQIISVLEALAEGWDVYAAGKPASDKAILQAIASRLRRDILHRSVSGRSAPKRIEDMRFAVALSFPGECRGYVERIAIRLRSELGEAHLFYDDDFKAQLARADQDNLLQNVYLRQSALIVVFLSSEYTTSEWCGLEWRAIRDIVKRKETARVMFIRFDDGVVDGALSIDGFIDARTHNPEQISRLIVQRASTTPGV